MTKMRFILDGTMRPKKIKEIEGLILFCCYVAIVICVLKVFLGCSEVERLIITTDCVQNAISDGSVYALHHPDAELYAVVGRTSSGEYHVEPVEVRNGEWIHYGYDKQEDYYYLWAIYDAEKHVRKILIDDIVLYPFAWFVEACRGSPDTITQERLKLYWSVEQGRNRQWGN